MGGVILNSEDLDADGRNFVLDNDIVLVKYYSTFNETWEKSGQSNQSWYNENFLPNDVFNTSSILTDRWTLINTAGSGGEVNQSNRLNLNVVKAEGGVSLSSDGKWRLVGDFEAKLYFDWSSYYNEYRSITHSFIKVGFDKENAVRIAFTFDGSDGFAFSSEKTVDRDLTFFDWKDNGSLFNVATIDIANNYTHLKIVRNSGGIETYISNGSTDTKVGDTVSGTAFSQDLFVEIGIEAKEYNTYRHSFSKFIVSGVITPIQEFFSTVRGRKKEFPENAIIAADSESLSIIDEDDSKLWLRFLYTDGGILEGPPKKIAACAGALHCATDDGLISIDFHRDRAFKYADDDILVTDEPLVSRNAPVNFKSYLNNTGDILENSINSVDCRLLEGTPHLAFTSEAGVFVKKVLTSGVAYSTSGPLPATEVFVSALGTLYWAGFDGGTNEGELSSYSNIIPILNSGISNFNRSSVYTEDTALYIFGKRITAIDVQTVTGADQVAIGSTEGVSFISKSPGAVATESLSFGVEAASINPFIDPNFDNVYLGVNWLVKYNAFLEGFFAEILTGSSIGTGTALKLYFTNVPSTGTLASGTYGRVYQNVDLTGVKHIYYDVELEYPTTGNAQDEHDWDLQVLVDGVSLKSYRDDDGPFVRLTESVDVSSYTGVHEVAFQLYIPSDTSSTSMTQKHAFIDNIRTKVGDPDYRIIPVGQVSIKDLILQYDDIGHKIYFSSSGGYGAIDLDDRSIDYFIPITSHVLDTEIISADFGRVENES